MICCPAELLELQEQCDGAQVQLRLQLLIAHDLVHFQGHFPVQAILPGATLLAWVAKFASTYFHKQFHAESMRQIKFHQPIKPTQQIILEILYHKQQQTLTFTYTDAQSACYARGHMKVTSAND